MKWIDQQPDVEAVMTALGGEPVVAIDTEADSLHSYFDKVCLVQLSSAHEDYIVDPLAKISLAPLGRVLADPKVTKVFHGADYDLRILNRDFGFEVNNLVDTMICAQLLGFQQFGLGALLKKYFDLDTDKSHQRADWAMRPLSPQMLHYAMTDTHYLIELASRLRAELEAAGRWEWAREEFARLEAIRFREPEPTEEAFRRLKGLGKLSRRSLGAVAALYDYRDGIARSLDRPAFKVMSNDTIIDIAKEMPQSLAELERLRSVPTIVARKYGKAIMERLAVVAAAPEESLPEKVAGRPWLRDPELERRVEKLKKVRDAVAAELAIDGSVLAPRHVLTAIATLAPKAPDELAAIPAMREWQRQLLAEKFLAALA